MQTRSFETSPSRRLVVALNRGEEVVQALYALAIENGVGAAHFTGIGAFSKATLAFFNLETRQYDEIPVDEQVEVLNISGNLTLFEGEPRVHAHATLSRPDGSTIGGHLLRGEVEPTLELFITVLDGRIERQKDPVTELPLITL